MVSSTLLAASIPLAVTLLLAVLALVLLARYVRHLEAVNLTSNEYSSRLKRELESRGPKRHAHDLPPGYAGVNSFVVGEAFQNWSYQISRFVEKWVREGDIVDSEERIQNLLFPEFPPDAAPGSPERQFAVFPNPNEYTARELCDLLSSRWRTTILKHILNATILPAVSIKMAGNPYTSLLPFQPRDMITLMQVLDFLEKHGSGEMWRHMADYPWSHAEPGEYPQHGPWLPMNRDLYVDLIESLLSPFLVTPTDKTADALARRKELDKIFDDAVFFGMKSLGVVGCNVHPAWEPRVDKKIWVRPALWLENLDSDGTAVYYWTAKPLQPCSTLVLKGGVQTIAI